MNLVLLKNISLVGIHWGAYTTKESSRLPVVWKDILSSANFLKRFSLILNVLLTIYRSLSSGRLRPVIYSEVFPLERITAGLEALESRKSWGKIVVRVREDKSELAAKL